MNDEKDKRIAELEDVIRPFAEAWNMHSWKDIPVSKMKFNLGSNVKLEDWERAAAALAHVREED